MCQICESVALAHHVQVCVVMSSAHLEAAGGDVSRGLLDNYLRRSHVRLRVLLQMSRPVIQEAETLICHP